MSTCLPHQFSFFGGFWAEGAVREGFPPFFCGPSLPGGSPASLSPSLARAPPPLCRLYEWHALAAPPPAALVPPPPPRAAPADTPPAADHATAHFMAGLRAQLRELGYPARAAPLMCWSLPPLPLPVAVLSVFGGAPQAVGGGMILMNGWGSRVGPRGTFH